MDKPALSSNWKKLQATLKKDAPVKRKEGDDIVKKRKLSEKQKPYRDTKSTFKRKRMSDADDSSTPATRRKTAAEAPVKTETSSRYKENEGRSPTYVLLPPRIQHSLVNSQYH
jgi:RNA exonuclease 4